MWKKSHPPSTAPTFQSWSRNHYLPTSSYKETVILDHFACNVSFTTHLTNKPSPPVIKILSEFCLVLWNLKYEWLKVSIGLGKRHETIHLDIILILIKASCFWDSKVDSLSVEDSPVPHNRSYLLCKNQMKHTFPRALFCILLQRPHHKSSAFSLSVFHRQSKHERICWWY